ncbi:MAG: PAS domain S-box protein, partial [Chitinophagaceae bacterium]
MPFSGTSRQNVPFADGLLQMVGNFSGLVISKISASGKFMEVNDSCTAVLGFEPKELIGRRVLDFFHPDEFLAFVSGSLVFPESPMQEPVLHRFLKADGSYVWFETISHAIRNPTSLQLQELYVISRPLNNTDFSPKESHLAATSGYRQAHTDTINLALEASQTGVWVWHASTELCEFDERMLGLLKVEPGTFDGSMESFLAMVHQDDRNLVISAFRGAIFGKSRFELSFRVVSKQNQHLYIHAVGGMQYLPNGVPDKLIGLCIDVTEQKIAEEKVKQQEAELLNIYNSSLSGIIWYEAVRDQNGNIVDFIFRKINKRGAGILRITEEEKIGKRLLQEFPAVDTTGIFDRYVQVVETGAGVEFEQRYNFEGLNLWLVFQASPLNDGLTLTFTEVSEQQKNQIALQQKQHLIDKINDTAPFLTALIDIQERKVNFSSKKISAWLGFVNEKRKNFNEDDLTDLLHPDDGARLASCLQQVSSSTDYDVLHFQFRMRSRFEGWRWLQMYVKVFNRDDLGLVKEVLCLVQDINEAEQNKIFLKSTLDSSLSGIMAFESIRNKSGVIEDFKWILVNKPAEQLIGRKARYVMGKKMLDEMPGNLSEGIFDKFVEVVETGQSVQFEHFYSFRGCLTWFLISAVKMGDGFTATFTDISSRKEAEQELLENKLFNEKITETAPFMIGIYELKTGKPLYFNQQLGNMLGYTTEQLADLYQNNFQAIVHPEDLDKVAAHFAALASFTDGEVAELESRALDANGNWKNLLSRDTVFRRDAQGNVQEVLSIVYDVSKQKRKSDLLNSVLEAALTGVCVFKSVRNAEKEIVDFEWLYANQKAAALNGVDFSELTGSLMLDKSPGFIRNEIFADLVKTAETGQTMIKEVFLDSADLKTWLKITATKHEDGLIYEGSAPATQVFLLVTPDAHLRLCFMLSEQNMLHLYQLSSEEDEDTRVYK